MTPLGSEEVPRPVRLSHRPPFALPLAWTLATLWILLAPGCSWFSLSDRKLSSELDSARTAIAAGDPASTIVRLERLAWLRRESIEVRRLLVEACRAVDTIESRRIAENALRELTVLDPDNSDFRFQLAEILIARGFDLDASRQLERILARDPRHARAHLALGYYYEARYRRNQWPQDLESLLDHFSRAADLDPDLYEARRKQVEALMLDGKIDGALLILERLLEKWPNDGWLYALAGACQARPGSYPEAAESFEHAFDRMSRAERAPCEDLSLVADPYTLAKFDGLSPDEREDFLRIFWRSKDPQPVTPVNERQVEHWRRVVIADLLYGHRRLGIRGWNTARGEMYIRYGAPIYEEYVQGSSSLFFSVPSWYHVYEVNGEELGVTFDDTALNGLFYFPFAGGATAADLASYTAPQSYVHRMGGRWLALAMEVAAFAPAAGASLDISFPLRPPSRAEVYLAVPVDSLNSYSGSSLDVGTVVFDHEWIEVARRREVLDLDRAQVAGEAGRALVHQVNLDLDPGDYFVATQAEGEAGAVIGTLTEQVTIDPFAGDSLKLSVPELAFAVDRNAGAAGPEDVEAFRKGDLTVVPNPTGRVQGAEPLVLYFEIYNLALVDGQGHYSLRYRIAPADRRGRSVFARMAGAFRTRAFIESRFEEESSSRTVRRYLTIDVSALKADRYALDLGVTDHVSGRRVERRLEFSRAAGTP